MADTLGWIVASKTVCSSPNPQYLQMWPCLEIAICTYIQVKLRSHWLGVDLRRRGRFGHRDMQRTPRRDRDDVWVMPLQAKDSKHRATPRSREGSSLQTSRGTSHAYTLILDLQPPGRWEHVFLLPKVTQSVSFCSCRPWKPIQLIIWEIQWATSEWWVRKEASYF